MNISNCSLKDECQFVKELKDKISDMQESYETDAEAKFYDYVDKYNSKKLLTASARELFIELGYRYSEDNYFISYIGSKNIAPVQYQIVFSKEYKSIELMPTINGKEHYFTRIDMELLQAINQQINELGWK